MYVCMYVYVYVYICMYVYMYVCMYMCMSGIYFPFSTQDGKTAAEVAQGEGYRNIAKLIIDEGIY